MVRLSFALMLLGMIGCGQPAASTGEVSVVMANGETCVGTPEVCAAKMSAFATPADTDASVESQSSTNESAAPGALQSQDDGWCGGECKVNCGGGATCCGPCCACANFCRGLKGKPPVPCERQG